MTIIVFLIDTSASMFQKTYVGGRTTLLDVAKSAVETFIKIRQRSIDSRIDRYMLLTFEEPPNNIKAGWKENLATFMNELKNLQCFSMTTMGVAVKQAFDILNINRMISGIDRYGQGRCPIHLETSVIVLITDGGKLTTVNGVHEDFNLPMNSPIPGSEMTREPFRWDQRLFALVLRLSGTPAIERDTGLVPSDCSPIDAMCEVTGGRSYCITSHRMLNQCIDSLVQKVQNGVVINFEKIGPDPPPPLFEKTDEIKDENGIIKDECIVEGSVGEKLDPSQASNTSWHNCRKMIYVPKSNQKGYIGFWPIPESFWPESSASSLPPRSAHPNVKFTCTSSEPLVIENLPFDKYELEPSPLTQYILSRKQPKTCWQVFVANSYKNSEVGHPFGYLKASTNLSCVNLFVMPYNYPVLLPLLDELVKIHRWKPTNEWRAQFQNYMRTLPSYYVGPLKRALTLLGQCIAGTPSNLAQSLIPENPETYPYGLSFSVHNYLKRLKNQAKVEYDRLCSEIIQRQTSVNALRVNSTPEQIRVQPRVTLKKELVTHPLLMEKFNCQKDQILEQGTVYVSTSDKERTAVSFKNPFDVPRNRLVHQVVRMRNNFLQPDWISLDQDSAHSLPVSQMGNYQEYLKRQTPQLREIESAPVRQHMFGNPFKIDKRMMVDEADIDLVASPGVNRYNKRPINLDTVLRPLSKRKPGALPKNFTMRKPNSTDTSPNQTPNVSPVHSPISWLAGLEKDLPSFNERPSIIVNGLDSPSNSERSRSPSPTLELNSFNVCDNTAIRSSIPTFGYSLTGSIEIPLSNSINDFYPSPSNDIDKQISSVLKEATNMNTLHTGINTENKTKAPLENKQEIEAQNFEIRKILNKLIRRPGKNFTELLENLRTLKGSTDVQIDVVKLVIKESLRFKRQYLASLLEDHIQELLSSEGK